MNIFEAKTLIRSLAALTLWVLCFGAALRKHKNKP